MRRNGKARFHPRAQARAYSEALNRGYGGTKGLVKLRALTDWMAGHMHAMRLVRTRVRALGLSLPQARFIVRGAPILEGRSKRHKDVVSA